jgi:predicted tellurium resistance membrane protein TerC
LIPDTLAMDITSVFSIDAVNAATGSKHFPFLHYAVVFNE